MEEDQLLEMTGSVEDIVFRNEKNGYTILELNNGQELVTVIGSLPWVSVGEVLHVMGKWTKHPTFGMQFKAEGFERFKPETTDALLKYLSSGAVKGIGPAMAAKIVDAFGENTLKVLEQEPERLTVIKGVTKAKALKLSEEFRQSHGVRDAMEVLCGYGLTPEEALRVWRVIGPSCVELIRENPYSICEEEAGVPFEKADAIAAALERPQDDAWRVRAGVEYVLRHNLNNGHTCIPADKLAAAAARMLGVPLELAQEAVEELAGDGTLVRRQLGGRDFLFLPRLFQAEVYAASRILTMLRFPAHPIPGAAGLIEAVEHQTGMQYAQLQKDAIREALENGLLILTGGPGTGKTTTLKAIIRILKEKGEQVLLAAPTGRAAKRMSDLTGQEAKTIHRLLQVEWDENDRQTFARNEKNLLDCDALILDELSMVDILLFEAVLRALPLGCRLIMVGDCDQLPSVGPGNVLGDLIASGKVPVVQLTEIFRQSMESLIVTSAHRIVAGQMPELANHSSDFFFLPCPDPDDLANLIVDLCRRRLPASYGYSPMTDIQVLAPGRKGELGTIELNRRLQAALNPPEKGKKEITIHGVLFREGDKVMQVKNDYHLGWTKFDGTTGEGVYNGDLGVLCEIDRKASTVTVQFEDRLVLYEMEAASELELAYAMTVHKSQGSEFAAVVMPMYPGPSQLSYRNLLYTAVTRARSLLVLAGTRQALAAMVENDRKTRRYSGLCRFLLGEGEE